MIGCRNPGKTGHSHDIAENNDNKTGAGSGIDLSYSDTEVLRAAQFPGVIGQGILGLCHTDSEMVHAHGDNLLQLAPGGRTVIDTVSPVDLVGDPFDLLLKGKRGLIERMILALLILKNFKDLLGQGDSSLAALGPHLRQGKFTALLLAEVPDQVCLRGRIRQKGIQGHHDGQTEAVQVLNVLVQIGDSPLQRRQVFLGQLILWKSAVILEGAHGRHQYNAVGMQAGHGSLDIQEFLGSQVSPEAGFRNDIVSHLESHRGSPDRIASMGAESYQRNMEKGLIEVAPLAYMRGRTLDNAFIILDEAQNTTPAQMKMFLTRIGFGSKAVITGDASQKDLSADQKSGLDVAAKVLSGIDDIAVCQLTGKDVVRHPLVQKIVNAYEEYEKKETRIRRDAMRIGSKTGPARRGHRA